MRYAIIPKNQHDAEPKIKVQYRDATSNLNIRDASWSPEKLAPTFLGPNCPKWPFLGPKVLFLAQNQFFVHILQFFRHHYDQTPKRQRFSFSSCCRASSWGATRARFWPKNCPKIWVFYATPIKPPFFGLRRTQLNEIITSTYPEVTLDTFGFSVGGRSVFGNKNAYYTIVSHGIVWYCMELLYMLWYCKVLHVIALYRMVLY